MEFLSNLLKCKQQQRKNPIKTSCVKDTSNGILIVTLAKITFAKMGFLKSTYLLTNAAITNLKTTSSKISFAKITL